MRHAEILAEVMAHIEGFIERPHPAFGKMPVCPFAKMARLRGLIDTAVVEFPLDPADDGLMKAVHDFKSQDRFLVRILIHPDKAIDVSRFIEFADDFERRLDGTGVMVFRGHPSDPFCVAGVLTRQDPYPNIQLIKKTTVDFYRGRLSSRYFQNWG